MKIRAKIEGSRKALEKEGSLRTKHDQGGRGTQGSAKGNLAQKAFLYFLLCLGDDCMLEDRVKRGLTKN
jgi:hypothetical protein